MLEIENLTKRFGGVRALTDVSLTARAGRVLGLIGENGAGKSTIVKCLTGIHRPTSGNIKVDGTVHVFSRPQDAASAGIAAIHQEPSMFDDLTVAENIFVGALPRRRGGFLDWGAMNRRATAMLQRIGSDLAPSALVKSLSVAERHMVSLAQALATDAAIIIFDEPTAALSQAEIQHLYGIVDSLTAEGKAIIFISHKFDEIFRICDDYVVLCDGALAGQGQIAEVTEDDVISMMVGRTVGDIYPKSAADIGEVVLEVSGFSHPTEFDSIDFDVRQGEILGFYGLVGAGRTEVMEAVFGLKTRSAGTVRIDGAPVSIASPADAMTAGIAYVPEDRQRHGAILPFPITSNISLPQLDRLGSGPFLNPAAETRLVEDFAERVSIRASSWRQKVSELSGGNQQKVVIGKWLATRPRLIILDEPTKGIDVGSKSAVHETIGSLVREGLAVVIVSSELEEVLGISDRIVVMARGRVVAEYARPDFSAERIVATAAGGAA
ncbi:sugar ABC transporter ATP-binding protein [Jannaschia sp. M317]|uniref:sugar ABC transporter ATP-binding protein n=1 Tax=Jannaschia sp. M317 TaxID=2867011 RepID=UPI0021A261FD|nr:sugar ABC transporter ATP-binding protein [Jannaschia sp. M317]UWQ17452.1 sugar ABC transporter ATP-binding protein [Jannaschia sp. M317]